MGSFDKVISSLVVNSVKSTVKSSLRFDELINQLKTSCPSNSELAKIINQKNQLSQTLNIVQTNLTTLNTLTNTLDKIVPPLDTAIKTIKSLPFPVSFPPGAGLPVNLIIKLSDTLETLKSFIESGKISIKGATYAFNIVTNNINTIQNKINDLNNIIVLCASKTNYTGSINISSFTSNNLLNTSINNNLENRLSPNSDNPLIYKGWKLILETDPNNKLSFPRRRVIGQKNSSNNGIITIISDFGPEGSQGYSYSSDIQVLINDIKFKIDNPNWSPTSVMSTIDDIEEAAEQAAREAAEAAERALREAEESKRGKVVFFGQTGALTNIPLGDFSGYGEGEYPSVSDIEGLNPTQTSERISAVRVGRGLRLTIFYSENFFTKPGIGQNDPQIQSKSKRIFEHDLNAVEDYIQVYVGDEFNDNVNSFIIDRLKGGTKMENPPERVATYRSSYALKRKSIKYLVDIDNNIISSNNRYDGYIIKGNIWNNVTSEFNPSNNILFRLEDNQNPTNIANNLFGVSLQDFINGNEVETYIYSNNLRYIRSSFNEYIGFESRLNFGKTFYIEQIS